VYENSLSVAVALVVLDEPRQITQEPTGRRLPKRSSSAVWPGTSWSRVTGPSGSRMCSDSSEVGKGKSLLTQTDLYGSPQGR
jgi:hypothetical protein